MLFSYRHACCLSYILLMANILSGCVLDQTHSKADHETFSLKNDDLVNGGLAFITPSTVTGQEQDKQTLAFSFAKAMQERRPDIRIVTLPETLGAINRANIAEDYKLMYVDYRDTGVFKRDLLTKVGDATGARYMAQLKLATFSQNSNDRLSLLGVRLVQTKQANIRIFFQIWDSKDGTIAWEGTEEMNYSWDTATEKPVTFKAIVQKAASNLIDLLP